MQEVGDDSKVSELLSSFSCVQDRDVEHFLHDRAIQFERLSKARTYLIFDREQLESRQKNLTIYGYFSLALKILSVPQGISNRARKEIDGFSAKISGNCINDFPCYLIGQLSRASNVPKEIISGKKLLDLSFDMIASAVMTVGGRYIMIECRNHPKLLRFYRENGFREISRVPDDNQIMIQMIRKISSF